MPKKRPARTPGYLRPDEYAVLKQFFTNMADPDQYREMSLEEKYIAHDGIEELINNIYRRGHVKTGIGVRAELRLPVFQELLAMRMQPAAVPPRHLNAEMRDSIQQYLRAVEIMEPLPPPT